MSESSNRSVVEALAEKILLKSQLGAKYRLFFKVSQDSKMDGLLKVSNILWFCFRSTHTPSKNTWKCVFLNPHIFPINLFSPLVPDLKQVTDDARAVMVELTDSVKSNRVPTF